VARASAGCTGRPELNFQIHLESGKVSGRFEPKEISDLPGSRPPIIGSISAYGEINFNHRLVGNAGKIVDANAYYTGTFRGILLQAHIAGLIVNVTAHSRWQELEVSIRDATTGR
jgi:hypothetical protein